MKQDVFDIRKFDEYKEDNHREVKKAKGGLPLSLWDSYSALANSNGGVILLGVLEREDGSWYTTGLKKDDTRKLIKNFWDTINDRKKVSINLLTDILEAYRATGLVLAAFLNFLKFFQHFFYPLRLN